MITIAVVVLAFMFLLHLWADWRLHKVQVRVIGGLVEEVEKWKRSAATCERS